MASNNALQVAKAYVDGMERQDREAVAATLADNVRHIFPLSPGGDEGLMAVFESKEGRFINHPSCRSPTRCASTTTSGGICSTSPRSWSPAHGLYEWVAGLHTLYTAGPDSHRM
jgi:hypothetical protein